jgi:hypothetical protein
LDVKNGWLASLRSLAAASAISSYPKPFQHKSLICIGLFSFSSAFGLPMLRIVSRFGYLVLPKAFPTQIVDLCWAFFILISLHKQACAAASNEKSLLR